MGNTTSYVYVPVATPSAPPAPSPVITNTITKTVVEYVDRYVESDYQKYVDRYNLTYTNGIPIQQLIQNHIKPIENKIQFLRELIQDNFVSMFDKFYNKQSKQNKTFQLLINDKKRMKEDEKKYDALFEEEEAKRQALGGRSRHQTLQEFVILFFYVTSIILTISLCIHEYRNTQNFGSTFKTFLLMFILLLIGSAAMIKYG